VPGAEAAAVLLGGEAARGPHPLRDFSLLLATEATLVGVFAATDVFLFYVFFEAMLIPMYFLIGRFGGPRRQYAAVKFFLYSLLGGLIMLASVIGCSCQRRAAGPGHVHWADLQRMRPRAGVHADLAVPRLLRGLRDQGAAGAVPHLAARRRCRGPDRGGRAAGRRAGQGGHVRLPALLPAAVPARLADVSRRWCSRWP
jgi:hypothetical protein